MPTKLIVHVGPHKTGATYIQRQCVNHRHFLKDNGVLYPETGITGFGHHAIVKAVRHKKWTTTDLYQNYMEEIADQEKVLLSSENFTLLREKDWLYFKNTIENPSILYFARPISDLLPSLWQTMILHGHSFSFPEFYMSTRGYNELLDPMFHSYQKQLDNYLDIFGQDSITLFGYSDLLASEKDIFECLIDKSFDIDISVTDKRYFNESRNHYQIELLRLLNKKYELQEQRKPAMTVRTALRQCTESLQEEIKHINFLLEPYSIKYDLSAARDEDAAFEKYLMNNFSDQIKSSNDHYFPTDNRKTINTFDSAAHLDHAVIQTLNKIYSKISQYFTVKQPTAKAV
ncbi:hypothetical protein AB833_29280 [Chromatiales bacterium (ex Bugula neritina AB1)]|nr:hypothetical protein AB833_29280 [Chromatiales bacterium (ex Bugula neritina AB1)]